MNKPDDSLEMDNASLSAQIHSHWTLEVDRAGMDKNNLMPIVLSQEKAGLLGPAYL